MTDYGIDVSMWNAVADANAVRGNNIAYAWCKATEGDGWVDPTFFNKVNQLRAAGLVVGAYHFFRGGSLAAQIDHFRQVAGDAGCLDVGALMPMADMEAADVRGVANDAVTVFADRVGVGPIDCYGNVDWWHNVLDFNAWGGRDVLGHVAHYNGDPGNPGYSYPRAAVHQHSQEGVVPGIPGAVDRNATMGTYDVRALTIGNVAAPRPDAAPAAPVAVVDSDTWTVEAGDTLSRVASAWGVTVSAVAAANGIPDADRIYVGQVIHRPGTAAVPSLPAPTGGTVQVAPGDTLSAIAAARGTTVAVLVALNHISNPDRIYAGQTLQLPDGASVAPRRFVDVAAGDTLGAIAARVGYPGGYPALAALNGIADANRVYVGQRIYY